MIQRDVFSTDEYVDHFQPDQAFNPFQKIYAAKRGDILATLRQDLAPEARILDLGGGMGRMAVPLAQKYKVTLCDLSGEMLRLAETAATESGVPEANLSTRRLNAAEPLPFADATFDRALSIDLLVHLPNPVATLRELRRVLHPAGKLFVDMSNSSPWWLFSYPRYVGRRPERWIRTWRGGGVLPEWQNVVRHYSQRQFYEMLSATGFAVEREWSYGPRWSPKWFLVQCSPQAEQ